MNCGRRYPILPTNFNYLPWLRRKIDEANARKRKGRKSLKLEAGERWGTRTPGTLIKSNADKSYFFRAFLKLESA